MRIDVIGGGPAGLYSAILLKKSFSDAQIEVVERNRADDTFGFGIVLSDETLGNLRAADPESHADIAANFAYWDDIFVQYQGRVMKSSGHGFSGIRRLTLLEILQRRAAQLGIPVRYQTDDEGLESHRGADLVLAADGINSAIREGWRDAFGPMVDQRTNRFVWLGAKMNLPGFYYSFREHAGGVWAMHAYQYTEGESTIVIETTDAAWLASGLSITDEAATVALVEKVFADDLKGARLLSNRSHWRQFPTINCRTWWNRLNGIPFVLLGDAAHTAHFSIGSGTKLALEDAITLHGALLSKFGAGATVATPQAIDNALAAYQEVRSQEASRIQHSANVSLVFFENVARFWKMDPVQFNVSLLTRSKQITYDNLKMRDAALVANATRWWNRNEAKRLRIPQTGTDPVTGKRTDAPAWLDAPPMFAPFRLRDLWLPNRVVVSPMAQYSAVDGVPNDWHLVHYGSRAQGGAGLVFVEMTCVSPEGRITPGCTGLWNRGQAQGFRRIADFVHANTASKLCMQLGHAGRKGSTQVGWEAMDMPLADTHRNWPLIAPSPIPYRDGVNQVPREMNRADMDEVIAQFVRATTLTVETDFDMIEVHMAHGYLLASFLSPITNRRTDRYGGSLRNRMRFPLEVFEAVRAAWPRERPISVRISATDWIEGGQTAADSVQVARALKSAGCDLMDVSTGQTDPAARPVYGRMYQAGFSEQIRLEVGMPTMAVGAITSGDQVNTLLLSGRADLVALARPHLADPYFTLRAAAEQDYRGVSWPLQYHTGASQLHSTLARGRPDARRARGAQAR